MKYEYFVSYSHVNKNGPGFGMMNYKTNYKIKCMEDIMILKTYIESICSLPCTQPVVIIFYTLMEN